MHEIPEVRNDLIKKHISDADFSGIGCEIPKCFGTLPQGNESAWAQGCKECYLYLNSGACADATHDVRERIDAREKATRFDAPERSCLKCGGTGTMVDRFGNKGTKPCWACCGTGKRDAPCPKCKATSGNDWSQCKGDCPLPGSPHYKRYAYKTDERGPYILDRTTNEPITIKIAVERLNEKKA